MTAARRGDWFRVSPEQVIVAAPEVIVTWDRTFFERVRDDPLWGQIEAVRKGRVYLSPTAPFGWVDRPPSPNRMMGLARMAGRFYPERWEGDPREDARDFYQTWYQVDLSEEDLDRLLEWAEGRPLS